MNARVLRKWSLTKFLMYLWLLPVIMLLVIWSQSATSMHLSTNTRRAITLLNHHQNQQIDNIMLNDDQQQQQQQQQQLLLLSMFDHQQENQQNNKMRQEAYLNKLNSPVISNYNNNNNQQQKQQQQQLQQQQQQEYPFEVFINIDTDSDVSNVAGNNAANDAANVPHVPKLNSQVIINLNSLTRSANLDTLSSSSSSSRNSNSQNEKFRRQYNIQSQQDILLLPSTDRVQHSKINQHHHQKQDNQQQQQQQPHKSQQEYFDYVDELISNEKSNKSSNSTSSSSSSSSSSISVKESRNHENYERVSSPSPPQIINNSSTSSSNNNRNQRRRTLQNDRLSMMMMMKKKKKMMIENDNSNENAAAIDNAAARIPNPMMNLEQQKIITANERLLQQREKRARTNAHRRRRLIRLKQLSSTNNYIRTIKPTTITVPSPLAAAAASLGTITTTTETSPNQAIIDNDLNKLMIGRNRRDSRLLYSQSAYSRQQQRKRPRRYCSARDPTQLAFEAPTVFEGKIISMSYDRRANFSVTFEVKEIFKKQPGYVLPHLLRLQFTYRNTSGECDIYREHMRPRGLVRDELEQGRVYILFVQQINSGNFTILGQPIKKTRRAVEAVKTGVSENYAQPASIKSLTASKTLVQNGEELRIVCRVRGQPPPKVTWFKDDKSINRNRRLYQFIHLKKRSELVVKSFNSSDAGLYECRAKNKVFRKPEKRTIRIEAFSRPADESYSHSTGDECTGNFEQYCLNGGTCQYFREISVPSCECPDGFVGDRCQEKEWNNVTPNPTFKTGFMADDPSPAIMESDEDDDGGGDDVNDSEEVLPTKDTVLINKLI